MRHRHTIAYNLSQLREATETMRTRGTQTGSCSINKSGSWVVSFRRMCQKRTGELGYGSTNRTLRAASAKERAAWDLSRDVPKSVLALAAKQIAEVNALAANPTRAASLQSVAEAYLKEGTGNLRPGTLRAYEGALENHILPVFGRLPIGEITPMQVQSFVRTKAAVRSAASVDHYHKVLGCVLAWARNMGYYPMERALPTERIQLPKSQPKRAAPVTVDEVAAVAAHLRPDMARLIWFLWHTGLRIGEALGLRWDCVALGPHDQELEGVVIPAGSIYVYRQFCNEGWGPVKSERSERIIAIPAAVRAILETQGTGGRDAGKTVWVNRRGKPYHPSSIQDKQLHPAQEAAGVRAWTFHKLRHAFNLRLRRVGADAVLRAAVCGHDVRINEQIYTRVDQGEVARLMDEMGRVN